MTMLWLSVQWHIYLHAFSAYGTHVWCTVLRYWTCRDGYPVALAYNVTKVNPSFVPSHARPCVLSDRTAKLQHQKAKVKTHMVTRPLAEQVHTLA